MGLYFMNLCFGRTVGHP